MTVVYWLLVLALIATGLAGIVLPALPGTVLIFAGILLGAWIDDFSRVGAWTLGITGLLTVLSFACDYLAAVLGAERVGASRQAIVGALLGSVAGILTGLWGLLVLPLAGAALGEYLAIRDLARAGRVGFATGVGLLLGTAVKIAIAFAMVGIFIAALLV